MSGSRPTVLAIYVSNLKPYFESQGLDWPAMLTDVGIAENALDDPDDYIDVNAVATLMENAATATNDPCFGLHCAEATPVGAVSFLGFIILKAPTTGDALEAFKRYLKIVITSIEMSYRIVDGTAYLIRSYPATFSVPRKQFDLYALALLVRRLRQGAGKDWNIERIEFDHSDPGCPEDCLRLLAPRILYNRTHCTVVLNIDSLDRNLRNADPKLFDILSQHADTLLEKQPESSGVVDQTCHQIGLTLHDKTPDLDAVAAALKYSPRTLQGLLAKEKTSFTKLLDYVRTQKAKYYLLETELQLTEVAYMLGFTDISTFSRASQRWFDKSPSAYRNAYRISKPGGTGGKVPKKGA